jgi:hypothetical protein
MSTPAEGLGWKAVVSIAAGCSVATAIIALYGARNWTRSLTTELNELQKRWTQLQHTIAALPLDDSGFALTIGSHVVVKEHGLVVNSSLWDTTNTQFCEKSGTVVAIDDDGDATVRLDSGEEIVCDVKFLVAGVTSDLKAHMTGMQAAMRNLSCAVGRAPPPVVFE